MENWLSLRNLSVLALIVAGTGLGAYLYEYKADQKDERGKGILFKAQQAYEEELKALPEAEKAVGATVDVDGRFGKTLVELKGLLERKDVSARAHFEGALRLGSLYLDYRHPDRAVEFFQSGSRAASSSFQKASADLLLGTAQAQSRMFRESSESFQRGLSQNVEALKADLLLGLVRVSIQLNDPAKAKTFGDQLNRELPKSKAAEIAQTLLKASP